MGHVGPTLKIKKKTKTKQKETDRDETGRESRERVFDLLFLFFSSLASLFDIRKSDRRNSSG